MHAALTVAIPLVGILSGPQVAPVEIASDVASHELTAIPILVTPSTASPAPADLADAFVAAGSRLTPVAVAGGAADLVIVRDPASQRGLDALIAVMEERLKSVGFRAPGEGDLARLLIPLRPTDRATLLWTSAAEAPQASDSGYDLFAYSPLYAHDDGGLSWLLARFDPPPLPERVADAVCAAGLLAAAGQRPRAVVLAADPKTEDASLLTPADARRCLADLRVSLFVWTTGASSVLSERWGEVEQLSTWDDLDAAAGRLRRALDAQRIVWLEGKQLLQDITLADGVTGIALAGVVETGR